MEGMASRDGLSRAGWLCFFAVLGLVAAAMLAGNARAEVTPAVPPAGTINKPAPTFVDYCTPDPTAMPPFPGCPVDGTLPDGDSCEDIFATGTCS